MWHVVQCPWLGERATREVAGIDGVIRLRMIEKIFVHLVFELIVGQPWMPVVGAVNDPYDESAPTLSLSS